MRSSAWAGDWPETQGYGPTDVDAEPPGHGYPHYHEGLDIGMPVGVECYATRSASVVIVQQGAVVLQDDDGTRWYYFHADRSAVSVGQRVTPGQLVAWSGDKAVAGGVQPTGPHLHIGVRRSPYRYQQDDFDITPLLSPPEEEDPLYTADDAAKLDDTHNKVNELWDLLRDGTHAPQNPNYLGTTLNAIRSDVEFLKSVPPPTDLAPVLAAISGLRADLDTFEEFVRAQFPGGHSTA